MGVLCFVVVVCLFCFLRALWSKKNNRTDSYWRYKDGSECCCCNTQKNLNLKLQDRTWSKDGKKVRHKKMQVKNSWFLLNYNLAGNVCLNLFSVKKCLAPVAPNLLSDSLRKMTVSHGLIPPMEFCCFEQLVIYFLRLVPRVSGL